MRLTPSSPFIHGEASRREAPLKSEASSTQGGDGDGVSTFS